MKGLKDYNISKITGFLPEEGSQQLPDQYEAWEKLMLTLPGSLKSGTLLNELKSFHTFSTEGLKHESHWQRAYVLLAFLIHAIVHGCSQTTIPTKLVEPFLVICSHIGVKPVLSYAGLCLYNWSKSQNSHVLQGLQCEFSFTGTTDEAAFYLVPVLVELRGGHLPNLLIQTLCKAAERDWNVVSQDLENCARTIADMTILMDQLSLCHPQVFYHEIRPYIGGLDVDFQRVDGTSLHVKHVGGSAVQSSLFMVLDHVFRVTHKLQILNDMKQFMPDGHRSFLEDISSQPSLLELMDKYEAPSEVHLKLTKCKVELQKWRSRHIAVVTRYIVLPAQAAARKNPEKAVQVGGTAGSSPLAFLKQMKDDLKV